MNFRRASFQSVTTINDFMVDPAVTRQIDNPDMKVLAVMSDARHPAYPDVPTAAPAAEATDDPWAAVDAIAPPAPTEDAPALAAEAPPAPASL